MTEKHSVSFFLLSFMLKLHKTKTRSILQELKKKLNQIKSNSKARTSGW